MEYEIAQEIWNLIYPIGSVYMSKNSTDPSTLFGGTWQRIKGRVIVGVDEDDEDFKEVLKIGGSKHIQDHNHQQWSFSWKESDDIQPGSNGAHRGLTWAFDDRTSGVKDLQTGNSGNLQPYISLYIWMRVE